MLMICSFPPPVHGQSLVNQQLCKEFDRRHMYIEYCDISPGAADGGRYHLTRVRRVLHACGRLLTTERQGGYFSSESGYGVLYSLLLFSVARLRNRRTFLHHHVYSYLNKPLRLHRLLTRLAGAECTHVALSPSMATTLRERYPAVRRCITLHNALFLPAALSAGPSRRPARADELVVGFIGRLDTSKGFDEFLAVIDTFADDGRVRFVVGGDHLGSPYAARLSTLVDRLGDRLDLRGFVSDEAKVRFFHDIDVLVFPSKYDNEGSPLVCFEALANAVPVLGTRVGAVDDLIDDECGRVFEQSTELVSELVARLRTYLDRPDWLAEHQAAARVRFRELDQRARAELTELHALLREDAPKASPRDGALDDDVAQR